MLFNFNFNLSDKKFLISTIILLISSLFYYYLYKHNETIIEKINTFTENKILSKHEQSLQTQHIPFYQNIINKAGYHFEEHKILTEGAISSRHGE